MSWEIAGHSATMATPSYGVLNTCKTWEEHIGTSASGMRPSGPVGIAGANAQPVGNLSGMAIAIRLVEAIAIGLEAIAGRLEA